MVLTHRPHPGVLIRTETLDEMLKEYPDINVITEQEVVVPGPIESSRQITENLLLSNKKEQSQRFGLDGTSLRLGLHRRLKQQEEMKSLWLGLMGIVKQSK